MDTEPMYTDTPPPDDALPSAEPEASETLPVSPAAEASAPDDAPEPEAAGGPSQEPPELGFATIVTNRDAAAPPEASEHAGEGVMPSVLVVEDNEDTRALLDRFLQRAYRVCAVPDALSALDW